MMKSIVFLGLMTFAVTNIAAQKVSSLKDAYKDKFYIGTAMNLDQIHESDKASVQIIQKEYNSIVAEDCMKSMYMQPQENHFFFDDADKFVKFGEENNMFIIGHTLIWHSQAPDWFFVDKDGKDVSPEVLKQRMKNHITTIVSRYKDRVKGWDVVNEAFLEDGSFRKSKFYEILGEEYLALAFQYAQEADPNAELYYNDYNEWYPEKVKAVTKFINTLKSKGLRIDGVGMQAHINLESPTIAEYEKAIIAYSNAGVKVSITELDISALPSPWGTSANISDKVQYNEVMNPYKNGLPPKVVKKWENQVQKYFQLFLKHKDKIKRVTFWGVTDNQSWKNDFPIKGRTDYPLLYDRQFKKKPVVNKLIKLAEKK